MKTMLLAKLSLVTVAFWAMGCEQAKTSNSSGKTEKTTTKVDVKKTDDDHDDHGAGPHGGTVIELGKYHGEITFDHGKKQATVYILDGKVKNAVPVSAEKLMLAITKPAFETELKPMPQEGDPMGKCSRFVATHDNFAKEQEFEGAVKGELNGKPILGDFKEKADKHDHDHKHEQGKKGEEKK